MHYRFKKPFLPLVIYFGKKAEKRKFSDIPILIGGCARSGTTILLSVLSAHSDLFCFPNELGIFNDAIKGENVDTGTKRIDRLYTAILFNRIPGKAKRWCEKSPANIHNIEHIDRYFKGRFQFIQIVRDGRDVILSKHPKNKDAYWVSPERWIRDVSVGLKYLDHPKVLTIKYEDLVMDHETTLEGICNFLNIPLSAELLNWHSHATVREMKSYFSSVQKLNSSSIGKWKKKENQERVKELTENPEGAALLKRLGYI